ncbi:MAG TPA: LuxR C-terminal-related transcriptional regulator [Streptosporangiaceae bacterium]|nr:LuxR C-terminal-related transcriptional regulator [Streptosporangiaceae bacterium]
MTAVPQVPLRGRDAQLAALDRHLAGADSGTGSVVIIEGGAGLGKTTLLHRALVSATGLGFRACRGTADPIEAVVDLAPLTEALFDGDPPLLDRAALPDTHAFPEQRFWLLQDIQGLLERAAMDGPILIGLDDLQWADNGTAAALRSLPHRLAGLPVVWLLATRPGQGPAQILAALAQLEAAGAEVLRLEPLDEAAVARLVADILDADPGTDLLRAAGQAHGNPFLLVEFLRGLREERIVVVKSGRATLVDERLPARVGEDMRRRLTRMPGPAERVAACGASLGRRFSVTELAAASGLSVPELVEPIRELVEADILAESGERLAFGHDLIREAVRASVPAAVRRALDRHGAQVLLARGALPVEVATQLAGSAEPGDEVAIETLLHAVEALGTTDPAAAADLAQRALRLTSAHHPLRGPLVSRRTVSLFAAGAAAEAKRFADTALRQALLPEQEAEVRLGIASMFSLSPDVRADNARDALALPGLPADLRAWLAALLLHNLVVGGRGDEAGRAVPDLAALVGAGDSREARFAFELAHAGLDYQLFDFESALRRLDAADRVGTSANVSQRLAHYFRCWPLAALDRFDEARAAAAAGIASATQDRQNWALHIFETWHGLQELQAGRLPEAAAALEGRFSADEADRVLGVIDAANVAALGRIHLHTGDQRAASEVARICQVMLETTAPAARRHAAWFLARQAMSGGSPAAAHRWLSALGADRRVFLFPLFPHDPADDPEVVRIALAAGDDELTAWVAEVTERRHRLNPSVPSLRAAAAHVRGLAGHATDELETAAALYRTTPRSLALASALEDLGRARVDDGSTADAIAAFDEALAITVEIGASWDAARIRRRLRRLGIRRRVQPPRIPQTGWPALTRAELQVARLVTQGQTNREIAEHLFVSPHTVSAHLRHIFDKLGVKSRVQLTRIAGATADRAD